MPIVRDDKLDAIKKAIVPWLRTKFLQAATIDLPRPVAPDGGGSSETIFLSPVICDHDGERQEHWVLRIEATGHRVYEDASVERQYRVMETLARTSNVPVPKVLWYEGDPAILGAPFFIMERVPGEVSSGHHHSQGLFLAATPAAREKMWHSAVETLAHVHAADIGPLQFLARPELGPTGLDQEIAVWNSYARWSGIPPHPILERTRQWLDERTPQHRPTGLAWGDARPGNMIFRDHVCRAVIDWETVSLGGAETDLGWWLFFDWYISEGIGVPRLEGLGRQEDVVPLWEGFSGRKAQSMEWHEVFATWRFGMISSRARLLMGQQPDAIYQDNAILRRLSVLTER